MFAALLGKVASAAAVTTAVLEAPINAKVKARESHAAADAGDHAGDHAAQEASGGGDGGGSGGDGGGGGGDVSSEANPAYRRNFSGGGDHVATDLVPGEALTPGAKPASRMAAQRASTPGKSGSGGRECPMGSKRSYVVREIGGMGGRGG